MAKTVSQINEKIKKGTVVVVSAEAFTAMAKEKDLKELSEEVDIVTTATFGPMCSSGAIINFGHWSPGIRMEEITLNGVNAYEGLAAVDTYIGATSESKFDATYGGANVIEELIDGKDVRLHARGKGTSSISSILETPTRTMQQQPTARTGSGTPIWAAFFPGSRT